MQFVNWGNQDLYQREIQVTRFDNKDPRSFNRKGVDCTLFESNNDL